MNWETYYEKINDWEVSTSVVKISSLESIGTPEEVAEAICMIGFEDIQGASRLLKKALQYGIKFSGEELAEMSDSCTDECFKAAFYQSADQFTTKDLDDLYSCIDDEILVEVALKYKIPIPEDMAEECENLLCLDTSTPISWEKFYNCYDNWPKDYVAARFSAITSFGSEDEVIEVISYLFGNDENNASRYIRKVLEQGITFAGDNLIEVTFLCDEATIRQAVLASQHRLNDEILEELYGIVDDELIEKVAQKQHLNLPECMREECDLDVIARLDCIDGDEALEYQTERMSRAELVEAYDYVLECLYKAHKKLVMALKLSIADVGSDKRALSIAKYAYILEANPFIDEAHHALEEIESQVQDKISVQNTRLNMGKWIVFHDVLGDGLVTDWMVQHRIQKMIKAVESAHKQVLNLKKKL